MATQRIAIAFDLYGTLLSTESIAHELAKLFGEDKSGSIAALWRRYQLEYTWRSNSMGTSPQKDTFIQSKNMFWTSADLKIY
jgi:2-haloacid dehalogenase